MANKRIHDLDDTATTLDSGAYLAVDSDSYTAAKKFAADTLPDPTGATDGYVWTADGANGAAWEAVSGGASDVTDLTTTTGSSTNMLRVAAVGGLEYRTVAQVLSDIGAAAASHTHGAGDIASGTLVHERGGLEADVSAYAGLVKISGGSTSAVTVTAFGESLIDDADASTARTTLGLGTMATEATGSYLAATGVTTGATSSAQTFTLGVVTGAIKPASDSTTALQLQNSSGTAVVTVDTINARLGVGATPTQKLHIETTTTTVALFNSTGNGTTGRSVFQLLRATQGWDISTNILRDSTDNFNLRQVGGTSNGDLYLRANFDANETNFPDVSVGIGISSGTNAKLHVDQSSGTAAIPVLLLDQADDSEEMIEFTGTVGTGNAIEAVGAKTLTTTHFIKCTITGVGNVYIPVGTIA